MNLEVFYGDIFVDVENNSVFNSFIARLWSRVNINYKFICIFDFPR